MGHAFNPLLMLPQSFLSVN